jgi:hypothetical protein
MFSKQGGRQSRLRQTGALEGDESFLSLNPLVVNRSCQMSFAGARLSHNQHRRRRLACQTNLVQDTMENLRSAFPLIETIAIGYPTAKGHQLFGKSQRSGDLFHVYRLDFSHDQQQPLTISQGEKIDVPPAAVRRLGDRSPDDKTLAPQNFSRGAKGAG